MPIPKGTKDGTKGKGNVFPLVSDVNVKESMRFFNVRLELP